MFKQVILLNLQDKCFGPNLGTIKTNMKSKLEDLNGKVEGLQKIEVHSECSSSSNADVIVEVLFDNEEAFKTFSSDETYNMVTKDVIVPFIDNRTHVEYEVKG